MKIKLDWKKYAETLRLAGAEGIVLLKNDGNVLPLDPKEKVALYGRAQFDYIKSGSGSGGLVNVPYVVNVYDGLKNSGRVAVDESIAERYRTWLVDNPYDRGIGWAGEPWSQVEMPLDEAIVKEDAKRNTAAIVVVGRLAGEDKDNSESEGSYLLRSDERAMIETVCKNYAKSVIVLNSGNVMDMKWVKEFNPSSVLYVWQGGAEGGNSIADILTGVLSPSGRLVDTIAENISDYPCMEDFGNKEKLVYTDDIFVGYRYFETFAKEKVLYPFGFGLSYTEFEHKAVLGHEEDKVCVVVEVKNTGAFPAKEVCQVYVKAPKGKLSKPARELKGFAKTKEIKPGKKVTVEITFPFSAMASFDDGGYTGNLNSYVLEPGEYEIYEGKNVREATCVGKINIPELIVTETVSEALGPHESFKRLAVGADGEKIYEDVPLRVSSQKEHCEEARKALKDIPYEAGLNYKFKDVYDKKITLDEFISSLKDEDLIELCQGEGMCSGRATPGTAGAYIASTDELEKHGLPTMCCSDGPSGIRMDTGGVAMQTSNGVSLACTFNKELVEEVFTYIGMELRIDEIDTLLGPGINIHRCPLNGRNFEYFSEDPFVSGTMTVAELKGMHKYNVTGTIKHFCCNNQETGRFTEDTVISKRALREIYLKSFEMAVKEAGAYSIMTSYNLVNGVHTASSFDLNQIVLRKDWGFTGITMTDWWSPLNLEGGESIRDGLGYMILAGGDVYMVNPNVAESENSKHAKESLKNGLIERKDLVRNAEELLSNALKSNAMARLAGKKDKVVHINPFESNSEKVNVIEVKVMDETPIDVSRLDMSKGVKNQIQITSDKASSYDLILETEIEGTEMAQINLSVSVNMSPKGAIARNGSDKSLKTDVIELGLIRNPLFNVNLVASQDGLTVKSLIIKRK